MGLFLFSGAGLPAVPASAAAPSVPALPSYQVGVTAYNAVPAQTKSDPSTTASGSFSNPEVVAARSVDLGKALPFGTVIKIEHVPAHNPNCGLQLVAPLIGYRVIADTMNERIHNHIDILFPTDTTVPLGNRRLNPANVLGACEQVTIVVVGHVDITNPADLPETQADLVQLLHTSNLALQ